MANINSRLVTACITYVLPWNWLNVQEHLRKQCKSIQWFRMSSPHHFACAMMQFMNYLYKHWLLEELQRLEISVSIPDFTLHMSSVEWNRGLTQKFPIVTAVVGTQPVILSEQTFTSCPGCLVLYWLHQACVQDRWGCDAISPVSITLTDIKQNGEEPGSIKNTESMWKISSLQFISHCRLYAFFFFECILLTC